MRVHTAFWIGMLLLAGATAGFFNMYNMASAATVDTERHYRAELTLGAVNTAQLILAAQQESYWVRIQTNTDVTYLNGTEPCNACDPSQEDLFFQAPSLYVDGGNFRIRLEETEWKLSIRPRESQMSGAYELIVSPVLPQTELTTEILEAIDAALQPLNALSQSVQALSFNEIIQTGKVQPPDGANIDSVLYAITQAPNWDVYAQLNGISLSGLRVDVLVELADPNLELPESLDLVIESRSSNFVRAAVLIHRLADLASLEGVTFVRLPSTPQPPVN